MKYFRWKSSTFKIFTLLLHHIQVHRYNFVVQVIRFWKKILIFWNFLNFFKVFWTKIWQFWKICWDILNKKLKFQNFLRCFGRKFLRKFWSLRKIWSLSDRWAVWECIRVNISARVRTRKLKIGRRTELESYFQDLDIRHRYARGNIICSKDMQIWFYTKNSKFSESS